MRVRLWVKTDQWIPFNVLQHKVGGLRMHQLPVVQRTYRKMLLKLYSTINPSLNRISPKIILCMIIWWNIMLIRWFLWNFNSSRMLSTCYLHTFSNFKWMPQWCHLYVGYWKNLSAVWWEWSKECHCCRG